MVRFPAAIFTIVQYTIIGSRVFGLAITVPQIPIILQKVYCRDINCFTVIFYVPCLWYGWECLWFISAQQYLWSFHYIRVDISDEVISWRRCVTLLTREPTRRLVFFNILLRELRKVNHYMNPIPSMKLTIIVNKYTSSLSAIIGGGWQRTQKWRRNIVAPTRHIIYVHPVATPW